MTPPTTPSHPVAPTLLAGLLVTGALAVVLAGVPSPLFDLDRHAVPKELALHLVGLLALPILAWSVPRVRLALPEYLLMAWLGWSAMSVAFAENYWLAWRALGVSVSGAIVFWMARRASQGGRGDAILAGLSAAAVLAAATGVAQAHGIEFALLAESRAPGGTLGNRNFLAHLSVITLPVLVFLTLRARNGLAAALGLAGLAILVGLVVLTRSRAAWLGGLAGLAMLGLGAIAARGAEGWSLPRGRRTKVAVALLAGAVAALVVPNQLEWRSESPYRDTLGALVDFQDGSGRGRLIQYRNTLGLVRLSPIFGTGPGNWAVEYPLVTTPGDPSFAGAAPIPTNPWPSSDWIAILAERGPVGVGILLLCGLTMAVMALRRLRHDDPRMAHRAATLLAVLAATFLCGAFDAVLLLAPPTLFFWAACGVLMPDSGPVLERPLSRRASQLLLPLAVGLSTTFAGRSGAQLAAIVTAGEGRVIADVRRASRIDPGNFRLQLIQAGRLRCEQARVHARMALSLFPHHPSAKRAQARCGRGQMAWGRPGPTLGVSAEMAAAITTVDVSNIIS